MAGGSAQAMTMKDGDDVAAMEPRPDGRGKADLHPTAPPYETWPQWSPGLMAVSYTHLRAHETVLDLVCRLLLDKNKTITI